MKKSEQRNPESDANKPRRDDFLIVGIGASAGGIQALKEFFENVAADSGMAYVVILHLSPDHDSRLAEVLQQSAPIPVTQVKKRVTVEPDHVYVVPPNEHLTMTGGDIAVSPNVRIEERRAPVDIFFRTLAESHQARAVCVVLSGTGANGSMGLKRVKEQGGVCFVQDPREAEFSEMPRNSIATNLVDRVLNVAEIPAHIAAYKKSLGTIEIPVHPQSRDEQQQQALREIFNILGFRTGHDFSNYKRPTILRRVERRINVQNLPDLPAYAAFIRENPDEAIALLKDLLISVTNFFRDKESFGYLETEILPKIFDGKKAEDQVRIWVCGCATGEEAYSLAMLCAERTSDLTDAPEVQIFATDIDDRAIAAAREGFYTLNDAADVSPERLRRFFNKEADGFRIRRELREMALFAPHNLLKDPPFSRLDLVTCRNLLIYLNAAAQERVMETFHFALEPGGFMVLGNSETVDGAGDLFAPVSREHHVFQSRQFSARTTVPVAETAFRSFRFEKTKALQPVLPAPERETRPSERISYGELHLRLLEQYAPSVVINEEYEIVHLSEGATGFLQLKGGELSQNLLDLIRPELRPELRAALLQAAQKQTNITVSNLTFNAETGTETINLQVRPVLGADDTARGFFLVLFEKTAEIAEPGEILVTAPEPFARQLEEELTRTKTQLRLAAEQFEAQTEELKASNEEHQAMNEELRSAMEELETSREELQSVNEELVTVNQELKIKVEELSHSNNDLSNLIASADIGTIFLDRAFRVNMFTPPAREIFNLIPADLGRPLSDITNRLETDDLIRDAETVLQSPQTVEREANLSDGRIFLLRISPYRTAGEHIGGIVITSLDISRRKRDEEALRESEARYRGIVNQTIAGIAEQDLDGLFITVNDHFCRITGYTREELLGKMRVQDITFPEDLSANLEKLQRLAEKGTAFDIEKRYIRKDGSPVWVHNFVSAICDASGKPKSIAAVVSDITKYKQAEAALRAKDEMLTRITDATPTMLTRCSRDLRYLFVNRATADFLGLAPEEIIGKPMVEILGETAFTAILPFVERVLQGERVEYETDISYPAGTRFMHVVYLPERDESGAVSGWYATVTDFTERKQRENYAAFLAEISQDLVRISDTDKILQTVSKKIAAFLNLSLCILAEINEAAGEVIYLYDWHRRDVPGVSGVGRFSDLASDEIFAALRSGETVVVADTQHDPRLNAEAHRQAKVGSFVSVPLIRDEEWKFVFAVHRSEAYNWHADEIEMIRELTNRIWTRLERARAESALRQSEERLRLLIESAADYAIFTMTFDGRINYWNMGAEKVFGWTESEVLGQPGDIIFTPEDRAKGIPAKEVKTALRHGRAPDERFHIRKDGSRFYVSGVMTLLKGKDGKVRGFVKIARDMTVLLEAEKALRDREMLQKLVGAQEDERRRIARDLHDELGQQLTALRLKLEKVRKMCDADDICAEIDQIDLIAKSIDDGVDFLAWELRPAALDQLGLIPALANYVRQWSHHSGVRAELLISSLKKRRFAREVETNLYRIVQEALNNVHKHAGAKSVEVMLERRGDLIVLIIQDDGRGFNVKGKATRKKGIGLIGMEERAALIQGVLEIESAPGEGTTIFVRVPASSVKKKSSNEK